MLQHRVTKPAVLFVCLGNICRSPMAEGAFRAAAQAAGFDCIVDSAGTASYHIDEPPDPRAIAVARAHGVNIAHIKGRELSPEDFHTYTHIFAMDKANLEGIKARAPRHGTALVSLLLDMVEGREGKSVPDPYYGDEADFQVCWNTISAATAVLVDKFSRAGA